MAREVRRRCVLLVLVVVSSLASNGCTSDSNGHDANPEAPGTTEAREGEAPREFTVAATADLVREAEGTAKVADPTLPVGHAPNPNTALIVVPQPDEESGCVEQVWLRASVVAGDPAEVFVWESLEEDAATFSDGTDLGQQVIREGSGRAAAEVRPGTTAQWDVTDLYRSWAARTRNRLVFAMKLAPTAENDGKTVEFASIESGDGPTLAWSSGCTE